VINSGIPGETTRQLLGRFEKELDTHHPQLVILTSGGNDFLHRLPDNETRGNLAAMIEISRKKGVPIVLVAVPKPSVFPSDHPLYADLAVEYEAPVLTQVLTDLLSAPAMKSDPIHLNAQGYRRWSTAMDVSLGRWGFVMGRED
jgi:lysophospholipase L1-like esterase